MADIKFSQFILETDPANVSHVVGYDGTDNVRITPQNLMVSPFMVTGTFRNMFGGDPGIFGDTLEFGAAASSASTHSSVLPIPIDCTLTAAGFKWISSTSATIGAGDVWEIFLYTMSNPLTGSTTSTLNYTQTGSLGISLTNADNGTTPGKFSSGLSFNLNAGDIINISGVETGAIGTSSQESELTLVFQPR
tara:strand:- start:594 stop:1169 length:576 start_codon:yes stop_codon:yes gene_type:complete